MPTERHKHTKHQRYLKQPKKDTRSTILYQLQKQKTTTKRQKKSYKQIQMNYKESQRDTEQQQSLKQKLETRQLQTDKTPTKLQQQQRDKGTDWPRSAHVSY